jgi:hypothetical protein
MILILDPILEKLNNASLKKIVLLKKNCYLLSLFNSECFCFAIHLFRIIKSFQYLIKLDFGTVPSVWYFLFFILSDTGIKIICITIL